jgi:hypothetical protein
MKNRTVLLSLIVLLAILSGKMPSASSVSASYGCQQNVRVFTTDTAPSDGILVFKTQFGASDHRRDTTAQMWWDVTAGQRINDVIHNVPAPRWARLWWYPDGQGDWYFLPSQYWQGDGTAASWYGVSCKPAVQPSYHTSFSSAIREDRLPHKACTTTPMPIYPPDGAVLNTLIPLFEWDNSNEPGAIELRLEIATTRYFRTFLGNTLYGYGNIAHTMGSNSLLTRDWRFNENLEPSTTYYWRVSFLCSKTEGRPDETREFTTGSGGVILPAPRLISPPDASTISWETVFLEWEAVDGAVEYLIEWEESAKTWYHYRWVSGTQYQITHGLKPNTSYEWRVAARNDYAIGEFSTRQFTTAP